MEITLKNLQKKIPIPGRKIRKVVKLALNKLEGKRGHVPFSNKLNNEKGPCPLFSHFNLSIVFVGPKRMRAINKAYLNHDYVTDVLTFNLGENTAEIIICPRVANSNAKSHQTSTENEIILYVIHGILHLSGYDDLDPKDILKMRQMENELLINSLPLVGRAREGGK